MKPLCSLANDGFHEAAGRSQLPDDAWVPGIGHVRPQRGLQVNPGEGEFGLQKGTDIAFIANGQTLNPIRQIPQRLAFIASGGGHRPASDDALYRDHPVSMKSIIRLFFGRVVAVISLPGKQPAAWGAGEDTQRQGTAVHDPNRIRRHAQVNDSAPMKNLFDRPEIGGLLSNGRARAEGGKPRPPMVVKVGPETHIGFQTQKLADHFHRDDFTIRQLRGKPSLAQTLTPHHRTPVFFYPAKYGDDKVFERHDGVPGALRWLAPLSVSHTAIPSSIIGKVEHRVYF